MSLETPSYAQLLEELENKSSDIKPNFNLIDAAGKTGINDPLWGHPDETITVDNKSIENMYKKLHKSHFNPCRYFIIGKIHTFNTVNTLNTTEQDLVYNYKNKKTYYYDSSNKTWKKFTFIDGLELREKKDISGNLIYGGFMVNTVFDDSMDEVVRGFNYVRQLVEDVKGRVTMEAFCSGNDATTLVLDEQCVRHLYKRTNPQDVSQKYFVVSKLYNFTSPQTPQPKDAMISHRDKSIYLYDEGLNKWLETRTTYESFSRMSEKTTPKGIVCGGFALTPDRQIATDVITGITQMPCPRRSEKAYYTWLVKQKK